MQGSSNEETFMGFRINTNVPSMIAQRNLSNVKKVQQESFQKLSSGNRISKSGDDAAGLAISEKMRATIKSGKQAVRNANDGVSMIQVAEGGMNEISNILVRLRELSVQSASDTVGDVERGFTDMEFQSLVQEIDRISNVTEFNGAKLLNGEGDTYDLQVGINSNTDESVLKYESGVTDVKASALGVDGMSVADKGSAASNLENIDLALNKLNENRANLGGLQNRLQSTVNNLQIFNENMSEANSRIRDTDIAEETTELTKSNILTNASTSVLAQANTAANSALRLIG